MQDWIETPEGNYCLTCFYLKEKTDRCVCGVEIEKGMKFCEECAARRTRRSKREYYHRKREEKTTGLMPRPTLACRECGEPRLCLQSEAFASNDSKCFWEHHILTGH
jgi:hypothetical protein